MSKIKKSNVTIVIGGDGFMLQTLKKNRNSKKYYFMELNYPEWIEYVC